MEITFANKRLARSLGTERNRTAYFGATVAKALRLRLAQLSSAPTLDVMLTLPGHCHELREDRKGQLAVDVTKNLRLIFAPTEHPPPSKDDGGLDWEAVTAITVLEVTDYHGK